MNLPPCYDCVLGVIFLLFTLFDSSSSKCASRNSSWQYLYVVLTMVAVTQAVWCHYILLSGKSGCCS